MESVRKSKLDNIRCCFLIVLLLFARVWEFNIDDILYDLSNSHNQKVQMHMLDLMSSIIMEGDGVTQELLDSILINLIPAHKVCQ